MDLSHLFTLQQPARHAACALALLAGLIPLTTQAQDPGKALGGLFQSLIKPNQPAQPAQQPNSPAGLAGALL
ncbi:MAG: peptidase M48, partial [Polaromonas sp.]|nr:peptidase M48 [Polaromonas sp.]